MYKNLLLISIMILGCLCAPSYATSVFYTPSFLGGDRWQNTYTVKNDTLSTPIEEFTIWFDLGFYDHLTIETADPLALEWDELIWDPDPVFGNPGAYDALAVMPNLGILPGQSVSGFAVSFDWLGEPGSTPGPQFFEVIDPGTFQTIDAGRTVIPALPTAPGFLLALSGLYAYLRHRKLSPTTK